ncbi:MAG: AMP-binding protein [Verrucomicrobiota bacterium]
MAQSVRAFGEPEWNSEDPHLLIVRNATASEALALQKLSENPFFFLMRRSSGKGERIARLLGLKVRSLQANATVQARELIVDQITRGNSVVLIQRGFEPEFVEEVLAKSRVPVRIIEIGRDDRVDLSLDYLILNHWPFYRKLRLYFSEKIAATECNFESVQVKQLELNQRAVEDHESLRGTLARACVQGLKKWQFRELFVDAGQGGKSLTGGMLLAVAWQVSEQIKMLPDKRIGVVLPPGIAAAIVNLACILAGKIPVNLNFTIGRAAVESAMETGEVKKVISAQQLQNRLKEFPWPEKIIDISVVLKNLDKISVLQKRLAVFFKSAKALSDQLELPLKGDHEEAGILFTSGSSGQPKGVPLSHRNILANAAQIEAVIPKEDVTSLLGCLPVFHSFGFTVTLWWPLIYGTKVITTPSPLEFTKIIQVIDTYKPSMYVTTPTFLRSVMKKAKKEQLEELTMVVTGAEKLPPALKEEFEEKFGIPVCEGYGMTEGTPVVAVNRIEHKRRFVPGRLVGSVGPLLPGLSVQVREPGTGARLSLRQSGMLWYSGPNIFRGYVGLPEKNAEILKQGWYVSGDVGRLDAQGFLYIEGRVSRFSKIAGEMVPHGTVENELMELLQKQPGEEVHVAIFGQADTAKGEALVALIDGEVDEKALRSAFQGKGLPNLWWPKRFVILDALPTLASGKLDLKSCQDIVDAQ